MAKKSCSCSAVKTIRTQNRCDNMLLALERRIAFDAAGAVTLHEIIILAQKPNPPTFS